MARFTEFSHEKETMPRRAFAFFHGSFSPSPAAGAVAGATPLRRAAFPQLAFRHPASAHSAASPADGRRSRISSVAADFMARGSFLFASADDIFLIFCAAPFIGTHSPRFSLFAAFRQVRKRAAAFGLAHHRRQHRRWKRVDVALMMYGRPLPCFADDMPACMPAHF